MFQHNFKRMYIYFHFKYLILIYYILGVYIDRFESNVKSTATHSENQKKPITHTHTAHERRCSRRFVQRICVCVCRSFAPNLTAECQPAYREHLYTLAAARTITVAFRGVGVCACEVCQTTELSLINIYIYIFNCCCHPRIACFCVARLSGVFCPPYKCSGVYGFSGSTKTECVVCFHMNQ